MASKLVGRTVCPECGNHKAHVKIMAGADGVPVAGKRHYRHCPDGDCGAQYFPRNDRQEKMLMEKTRPEGTAPVSEQPAAPPAEPPKPTQEQLNTIGQRAAAQDAKQNQPDSSIVPRTKLVFGVRVPA